MTNSDIQFYQTEQFLKKEGISYKSFKPVEKDPPDFILITNNKKQIGIEHSRLIVNDGTKIRSEYETKDQIIKLAQNIHEISGLPPTNVYFEFRGGLSIKKGDFNKAAQALFSIISKYIPELADKKSVEIKISNEALPDYINEIKIKRYKGNTKSLWQRKGIIWSGSMPLKTLVEKIESKNKRLIETGYFKNFDETWLLLVFEGREWSEFATYRPDNFNLNDEWKFDRIYVFGLFETEIERIK